MGHGISFFNELFTMNGIGANDRRVMKALKETLGLDQYPEKINPLIHDV